MRIVLALVALLLSATSTVRVEMEYVDRTNKSDRLEASVKDTKSDRLDADDRELILGDDMDADYVDPELVARDYSVEVGGFDSPMEARFWLEFPDEFRDPRLRELGWRMNLRVAQYRQRLEPVAVAAMELLTVVAKR